MIFVDNIRYIAVAPSGDHPDWRVVDNHLTAQGDWMAVGRASISNVLLSYLMAAVMPPTNEKVNPGLACSFCTQETCLPNICTTAGLEGGGHDEAHAAQHVATRRKVGGL